MSHKFLEVFLTVTIGRANGYQEETWHEGTHCWSEIGDKISQTTSARNLCVLILLQEAFECAGHDRTWSQHVSD